MAVDCNFKLTQEAILNFLVERGGKVKNTDLIENFKAVFPEEPEKKASARSRFKNLVDNIAFVKAESGVKYVCLRKKFREAAKERHNTSVTSGTDTQTLNDLSDINEKFLVDRCRPARGQDSGHDAVEDSDQPCTAAAGAAAAAGDELQPQTPPGSGYGNDSQVIVPHVFSPVSTSLDKRDDKRECHDFVCVADEVDGNSGEMGNRQSVRRATRESKKEHVRRERDVPEIAVIEASPLPAEGSMFTLPGPVQTGATGQAFTFTNALKSDSLEGLEEVEETNVIRRQSSKGPHVRPRLSDEGGVSGQVDSQSLSGSEGTSSPKGSRQHFIKVMMNTSPQLRRSMVLCNSVSLSTKSDSDSVSLVSSNLDDERASVTLDPLEHEWMMCASDGEWDSLNRLLTTEPVLVLRKDFVTGFTCLHWAAKHGKPELLALIINFAKQHDIPISVNVRSNTGYTPLHIAAMHNHMEVVKLLIGAYNADVEIRDYSGRKACQYLTDSVSVDIQDIIGAYEHSENKDCGGQGQWRFSKVLQSNLKPFRHFSANACDFVDGEGRPREKPVRRKSSFSRIKPKLERFRMRTSQIIHSTSFWDTEELEGDEKGSFSSRPKTHFFR